MFAAEKIAPEPEEVIDRVPVVNAFDAIVVGVAVKLAYVPPIAATETAATVASERRMFLESISAVPFAVGCPQCRHDRKGNERRRV
jgi:hypothetical protein